jgi:hypothetical protein
MARVFDADVSITAVDRALYLIVGAHGAHASPAAAVVRAGGAVAADLGEGRLLATLSFPGFSQLRRDTDIARAGPVTIDSQRFAMFMRILGFSEPDDP